MTVTTKGGSIINKVEDLLSPRAKTKETDQAQKILIVGAEVTPYANEGGISRVLAYLATALGRLGHDVRIFMPKFGSIDAKEYQLEMVYSGLKVPTDNEEKPFLMCNVKKHQIPGRPLVYFLENREYYELRANVYGYYDDEIRWALLSRGVLEFLKCCSDWMPDVIHANDWQTGWVPNYLKTTYSNEPVLENIATLFTMHNLSYQGMFDHRNVSDLDYDDGRSHIVDFFNPRMKKLNFMRRGIIYSDLTNTVSPTYAKEILKPEFGEGLDRLLTEMRSKVNGVLNGIDYYDYNPATDKLVPHNYDLYTLEKRSLNKRALQDEFDLKVDPNIPIIGYVGRLAQHQKGLELLFELLPHLLKIYNVQFVMVGGADGFVIDQVRMVQEEFPNMVGAHLMFEENLPRLVFSGADFITVPSRFEPCGLPQMEGMRYGAVPIVHKTGGLADSVHNFSREIDEGFGFVFEDYDVYSYFATIIRALETFRDKQTFRKLQKRAMQQDNSWEARADSYVRLYEKANQIHLNELQKEGKITQSES